MLRPVSHFLTAATLLLSSHLLMAAPIDINTASATELAATLVGVGPQKAEAIVAEREANGPFRSVEELVRVRGIGERTIERNREQLTADTGPMQDE